MLKSVLLGRQTMVWQRPEMIVADLGESKVMMNIESGKYYSLDGIANRIWGLIAHPCTIANVVVALGQEYDVDEEQCCTDVLTFLKVMVAGGLVASD
jgi:hypothetical protein